MKLKKAVTAVLCAVFAMSFGGCSIVDFSSDNLLRPPKAMGDEAEIEQLISDNAKSGYTLKYPKNGNYRSAIVMVDLNKDDKNEAIAFFRNTNDPALIHMLVMYSDNGKWKLSSDNVAEAADIDRVDFADMDSDNSLEILAGYTTYTPNINRLFCYSYDNGKTKDIKSDNNYSSFYCGDFDNDGNSEIMTLLLYTTENEASASMIDYNSNDTSLYTKAVVNMDSNIVKFKNVSVSDFGNNVSGLIIDGSTANEEINTQIIYYNNQHSQLRNPLLKEKVKNITQRSGSVISCDIDSDGKTEIPVITKLPVPDNNDASNSADRTEWYNFIEAGEAFTPKISTIANYDYNYFFKYPSKWNINSITALINKSDSNTQFYCRGADKAYTLLFEIKVFPIDDWNNGTATDDYTLISKSDKYAYTFKNINTDLSESLSDDEIKTGFINLIETTEQSETK